MRIFTALTTNTDSGSANRGETLLIVCAGDNVAAARRDAENFLCNTADTHLMMGVFEGTIASEDSVWSRAFKQEITHAARECDTLMARDLMMDWARLQYGYYAACEMPPEELQHDYPKHDVHVERWGNQWRLWDSKQNGMHGYTLLNQAIAAGNATLAETRAGFLEALAEKQSDSAPTV